MHENVPHEIITSVMYNPIITLLLEQVTKWHMSPIMVDFGGGIWGLQMAVSFEVRRSVMIDLNKLFAIFA